MFESLKQAFDKGVEYAFTTTKQIEKAAIQFAEDNNLNKKEAKKVLDHWLKKSEEMKAALEKQVAEIQKATITKMKLVTREDYELLEARIKKLEGVRKPAKAVAKPRSVNKTARRKPV